MHLGTWRKFAFLAMVCLICLHAAFGVKSSTAQDHWQAAIILSKNIKPYNLARQGIEKRIAKDNGQARVFLLGELEDIEQEGLKTRLLKNHYSPVIGIGPEAVDFIWSNALNDHLPSIYTMVLDPESIINPTRNPCGISLFIPIEKRLELLSEKLGSLNTLGLLFNPRNNNDFYFRAVQAGERLGIEIYPLKISAQKEIPNELAANWANIDALWLIPDKTVISKKLVQFIIKQGLYNNKPIIGYNQFFYNSGAAIVFLLDYFQIGQQTGELAVKLKNKGQCEGKDPVFEVLVNTKVFERLGLNLP